MLTIKSDIQSLELANQVLVSKISSSYKGVPVVFDLVIQPFDKLLLDEEGYRNINQDGIVIIGSRGELTSKGLEAIEILRPLGKNIPNNLSAVYLFIDSFVIDSAESKVRIHGHFNDESTYELDLFYKEFRVNFQAEKDAVLKEANYIPYEINM